MRYPRGLVRISDHVPCGGLAPNLPCMGMVYKPFKDRRHTPDFTDHLFKKYIEYKHYNIDDFDVYNVVPKSLQLAKTSLLRYAQDPGPFSVSYVQQLFEESIEALGTMMHQYLCDSSMYTYDQVLGNLQALKSPGYPWNLQYPYKIDYWVSSDREFFDLYWDMLSTNDYIKTLCNVSIKQELRLKTKINEGNVRSIIAMDVNHVVSHSCLCMHQNEAVKAHLFETPFMLGLNLLNGGADRLVRHMSPPEWAGPCVIELDGKKFDGTCKYDPHFKGIAKLRYRWLTREFRTPENLRRLENIYFELCHSPLVNVDGHVYRRYTGNPSGQACTTPDNSFKNWMDMYVLWCLCVPKDFRNLSAFTRNVRVIIVGDDVSLAVNPLFHRHFNHNTIAKNSKLINMVYHFASEKFEYFQDTTFLGHSFVICDDHPHHGLRMYYPSIDSVKMRCSLLQFNEEGTTAMSIIRACALRNETFANKDDRAFFDDYISYLRIRYFQSNDSDIRAAWRAYLTDNQLHELYSGYTSLGLFMESQKVRFDNITVSDKGTQTVIQELTEISADHIPVVLLETC